LNFIIFPAVALMLTFSAAAQNSTSKPSIGFVNSSKILQEYPEAQEITKRLDATGKMWQDELGRIATELQTKLEDFQKKEPLLKEDEKQSRRQELIAIEQRGIQYRQEKFGADGELASLTDSLMTPLKQKVIKVIEQVAKDEKLQFIFDRNDQIMVLLYGDSRYDFTNLVIDRLKRGN
jgi:Skp family chaperone for outer membrane proteins